MGSPRPCPTRSTSEDRGSCVLDAGHPPVSELRAHRFPTVPDVRDRLSPITRIRIHERLLQAQGLIDQAADELGPRDESKEELKGLAREVWHHGLELLDDIDADRYGRDR